MKKISFLSLVFILCLTMDADAFHRRLLHGSAHHGVPVMPFNRLPGFALPPIVGGSSPSIEVPRQVIDNLNAADKNTS